MTIKEFFSFKTNKYFWVNILVMIVAVVILLLFGVLKWLDVYTRHGEAVVVPDVKGMTVDEASKMFRNHGLVCVVSDSNYVKNMAAGIVLDVNPGIGQKVKEGRTIYLTEYFFTCCSRCGGQQFSAPGTGESACCRIQADRDSVDER